MALTIPKNDSLRGYRLAFWISVIVFAVVLVMLLTFMGRRDTSRQAPSPSKSAQLTFAAAGDFGTSEQMRAGLQAIKQQKTAFTLALGDLSYGETETEEQWCDIVKSTLGQTYAFQLLAGNHEIALEGFPPQGHIDRFATCLPNRQPNMQGTYGQQYFFDYQKLARLILISPDLPINGQTRTYLPGTPERLWLTNAIDEARRGGIQWVVVGMHKNCISIGGKSCEIGSDLMTLLVEKKVDLILQGHEHGYMRSKQLTLGEKCPAISEGGFHPSCLAQPVAANSYKAGQGSVLIIAGTGGASQREIHTDDSDFPFFEAWKGLGSDPTYGPVVVTMNPKSLEARLIDGSSIVKDRLTIAR